MIYSVKMNLIVFCVNSIIRKRVDVRNRKKKNRHVMIRIAAYFLRNNEIVTLALFPTFYNVLFILKHQISRNVPT